MSDRPNVAKIVRENMDQLQAEIEERKREAGSYESLLHARREAYQESGVPISKDEATDLVRRHSALPPYSDEKLDQEALQEHFDNRDTEFNMLIMRALRSVEDVAEIEEMAEVDPLFFDALLRAATIVFNPEYDHLYFPTKERLFRWFKDVGNGRISRPTRHKRHPADYGFQPPVSPRPNKSLCDGNRIIRRAEAQALFREGIKRGMLSACTEGELPKYVWAVDEYGHVYEAKRGGDGSEYHGYELGDDDGDMKRLVIKEWNLRCQTNS